VSQDAPAAPGRKTKRKEKKKRKKEKTKCGKRKEADGRDIQFGGS